MSKHKERRASRDKSMYKVQVDITRQNAQRRAATHLRHFPTDRQAIDAFKSTYGAPALAGQLKNPTRKGQRLLMRMSS